MPVALAVFTLASIVNFDFAMQDPTTQPSSSQPSGLSRDDPAISGDLVFRLRSVRVEKPRILDVFDEYREPAEPWLVVRFSLLNKSRFMKYDYANPYDPHGDSAVVVTDDVGNRYKTMRLRNGARPADYVGSKSIYPGYDVDDIFVCERPIQNLRELYIELKMDGFEEPIRYRIEKRRIER